ncbi:MAG: protoheme IX farnesyltransferase [Gammaproteobacteria bacterium]|nr:protoheme IX farnesyltransferase [Gammaproteobacteria bacterium]
MSISVRHYYELCKPRVVMLMLVTSTVGMCLAPTTHSLLHVLLLGNLGIAFVASAAAALNHVADKHIDKIMLRTQYRPVVQGIISPFNCILFACILCSIGIFILYFFINPLTAILTFASSVGYAFFYTLYLKHATPQNIVIGGLAGAFPPLLGWTSVTNAISPEALLLVLIIYVWTPPHFWALAIYRLEDYSKANVPMLPLTHGVYYTKLNILLYTILLIVATLMPYIVSMSGLVYLIGVMMANMVFLYYAIKLYISNDKKYAIGTFWYSIYYLGIVFVLLLIDHYTIRY